MGKSANAELYRQLEQQARRNEPTEAERAADWDGDEWEQPPQGFSDFYNWKIKADVGAMKGRE